MSSVLTNAPLPRSNQSFYINFFYEKTFAYSDTMMNATDINES